MFYIIYFILLYELFGVEITYYITKISLIKMLWKSISLFFFLGPKIIFKNVYIFGNF